jgi:hypothetical protein
MDAFTDWLVVRGPAVTRAMNLHREQICGAVSARLATVFPTLCYDPQRPDAARFQQHTYYEVPRRFQRVLEAVILFQSLTIIEKEYIWGWPILITYGVTRQQMLAQVRWYFDALRTSIPFEPADLPNLTILEKSILQIVHQVTAAAPPGSLETLIELQPRIYGQNGKSH